VWHSFRGREKGQQGPENRKPEVARPRPVKGGTWIRFAPAYIGITGRRRARES